MANYPVAFILYASLTPFLKQNNNGRIINVNTFARMQGMGKLNVETTTFGNDFKSGCAYNNAKVAKATMMVTFA